MAFEASQELLARLCDPLTRQPLRLLSESEVGELQSQVARGKARRKAGAEDFQGALLSEDGCRAYPIVDDIPYLLIEEAIELDEPLQVG